MTGGSLEEADETWDIDKKPIPNFNFDNTNCYVQILVDGNNTARNIF